MKKYEKRIMDYENSKKIMKKYNVPSANNIITITIK